VLGENIVSVHAKDIRMEPKLTIHLQEVRPGLGDLDYRTFLTEMSKLPLDTPFILEHLPQEEYDAAQAYVLEVANEVRVRFYEPVDRGSD
jgi:sugar phosphate isomerase/epimerase